MNADTPIREAMIRTPKVLEQEQTLRDARETMRELEVRHLPVVHQGQLVGILSERDVHLLEAQSELASDRIPIKAAMTRNVLIAAPDWPIGRVVEEMARTKHGSTVITQGGHVVGIFTTVDALRVLSMCLARSPS